MDKGTFQTLASKISADADTYRYLKKQIAEEDARAEELRVQYDNLLKAREIVTAVSKKMHQQLEARITNIVSLALSAVFPDPYEFQLRFVERRNQTEADFLLLKDGEVSNIIDSVGGGVLDVVAFALRVAALSLVKGQRLIVLDEPFKHLSPGLQPKASEMMRQLSENLGVQFIMVSHADNIIDSADRTFVVSKGTVTVQEG
jgi:DNA repair exonuclease SbcCD ATPase subunit